MPKQKLIALAFPLGIPHLERIAHGIVRFAQERRLRWSYLTSPESLTLSATQLNGWRGDGAVALINTRAESEQMKAASFPVVNISGAIAQCNIPRVIVDNVRIGEVAADHLLARGFQHYAYYGLARTWYSHERGRGFLARLKDAGMTCAEYKTRPLFSSLFVEWEKEQQRLAVWLDSLTKPVGLFAASDYRARIALDACHACRLRVPHDVAIIGVNNDELVCEHSDPPLSSVARSGEAVGEQAAAMLDRLLRGRRPAAPEVLVPPDGVVARASTDVCAVSDDRLAAAIRFIQEHLHENIGIDTVLRHTGISRRCLEQLFHGALGVTPYDYLCRIRMEHAKRQLRESPKARLHDIAAGSGFTNTKHMNSVFLRLANVTPRQYRQEHGSGEA